MRAASWKSTRRSAIVFLENHRAHLLRRDRREVVLGGPDRLILRRSPFGAQVASVGEPADQRDSSIPSPGCYQRRTAGGGQPRFIGKREQEALAPQRHPDRAPTGTECAERFRESRSLVVHDRS